jgi:UDP-N-acetylmuramyl pentapeptide phosphotransferase/UDP-N-acetylglucosamine-1-phosphate transferase
MQLHTVAVLLSAITAFWVAYKAIPIVIRVVIRKNLMDEPDGNRKIHTHRIPTMGGIGIFAGFFFASTIMTSLMGYDIHPLFVVSTVILLLVGIADDLIHISANKKLVAQIIVAALAITGSSVLINDFGGVFGVHSVPSLVSYPITIFAFIIVINAYNLIDGVDGLAAGLGMVIASTFGGFFLLNENYEMAIYSFGLVGALAGFLIYNFNPAQIFMGDTGSLIVGFTLAFLGLQYQGLSGENTKWISGEYASIVLVSTLIIPLYDTLRVVIIRTKRGVSPFRPGKEHVHHVLMGYGFNHRQTAGYLVLANIFLIGFTITLATTGLNINAILALLVVACLIVLPTRSKLIFFFDLLGKPYPDPLKEALLERQRGSNAVLTANGTPVRESFSSMERLENVDH